MTPRATVAADPNFVPLGAPVFLDDATGPRPTASGLRRIPAARSRAPNRFDTFWGAGPEAAAIAGGMSSIGRGADPAAQGHEPARALAQP